MTTRIRLKKWPAGVAASTTGMSHGYAERLEAAMAAFAKSWWRE
jgi:hypothetical protein